MILPAQAVGSHAGAGGERPAVESDYTHIRWTLDVPLAPEEVREVAFRAILE